MAKTGINIRISDTVLGNPIDVNTTSMLVLAGTSEQRLVKVRSYEEFILKAPSAGDDLKVAVERYFKPNDSLSISGNLLWVAELSGDNSGEPPTTESLIRLIRQTVDESFDERPRQVILVDGRTDYPWSIDSDYHNTLVETLHREGFRCVFIHSTVLRVDEGSPFPDIDELDDLTKENMPFMAKSIVSRGADDIGLGGVEAASLLSTLSVGTSIGDGGLQAIATPDHLFARETGVDPADAGILTKPVRSLSLTEVDMLGEKGYLFTRTRPPRNGLWWNDGATCNDPDNALSTLEMGRTICSIADDLQAFFVPYLNTRVPVTNTGDIQSTYKQVVLDNARAAVIQRYIENGDISDARIGLVAKDNDMIGTRTWEVTLSILPAPTLRWIDGYVFYVKNLA